MPSSAILSKHVPRVETITQATQCMRLANDAGLNAEWLAWFIGGLRQGMTPDEAAREACWEWDLL